MSERTFRAVVASVLVGALVLAAVVVIALLPRATAPSPRPSPAATAAPTPMPSAVPTSAGPALAAADVVGVGMIARGSDSGSTLVLRFFELRVDSIPDAPGSFQLALTDAAGDGSTVAFVGTPSIDAPGSLGATATFVAPNVLMISIEASDTLNLEPIAVSGLGIRVSPTAAVGALGARLDAFSGSLAGGAANDIVPTPGTVVAGP